MPRGGPDYGAYAPRETIGSIADLGELAVRLGSILTYDRLGNLLWLDDFEDAPFKWEVLGSGVGYAAARDSNYARNKTYSVKLDTAGGDGDTVSIYKYFAKPVLSKIGLEVHLASATLSNILKLRFKAYTGALYLEGAVRWNRTTEKLQYLDSAGTWQDLATGLAGVAVLSMWNPIKLVVDLANVKYTRLRFRDATYDLSSYALISSASTLTPYLYVEIHEEAIGAAARTVYADDFILTQNEP